MLVRGLKSQPLGATLSSVTGVTPLYLYDALSWSWRLSCVCDLTVEWVSCRYIFFFWLIWPYSTNDFWHLQPSLTHSTRPQGWPTGIWGPSIQESDLHHDICCGGCSASRLWQQRHRACRTFNTIRPGEGGCHQRKRKGPSCRIFIMTSAVSSLRSHVSWR